MDNIPRKTHLEDAVKEEIQSQAFCWVKYN